ncbi:MAG: hypothetical protein ACJ8GN_12150 [Longimicrobiaceae bacterium]
MRIRSVLLAVTLLVLTAAKGVAQKDSRWSEVTESESAILSVDHSTIRRAHEFLH